MKVGMMTAWNQDAGPSICAELTGREWVRAGHEVRVFSFISSDIHGSAIVGRDEDFVCRCFSTREKGYLDPRPMLEFRPDIFVVQDIGVMPMDELAKVFPRLRKSAKTVHVVHEAELSAIPSFYQFDWDAIVCFDKRYEEFLARAFDKKSITIIPHPLYQWRPGDRVATRQKLGLPQDRRIVLIFGHCLQEKLLILGSLRQLAKRFDLLLLIVSIHGRGPIKGNGVEVEIRKEAPNWERLYEYLHAADVLVVNKGLTERKVVVSTTVYQCLGAGTPVFSYDSSLVETIPDDVIVKYRNYGEFETSLADLFENEKKAEQLRRAQKRYVREYSPENIARAYFDLFNRRRSK